MFIPAQEDALLWQTNVSSVGAALGTGVLSGAADTKGSAVELLSSLDFDAYGLFIQMRDVAGSAAARRGTLDLLGGASTEEVLIADILCGQAGNITTSATVRRFFFPLYIPSGTRIACKFACSTASVTCRVGIWLFGGRTSPLGRSATKIVTYGVSGVTNGTTVALGTSAAEGSWTQIAASTSEDHWGAVPGMQFNDTNMVARGNSIDIGIGSATEEQIGMPYEIHTGTTEVAQEGDDCYVTHDIPSGTRLVMRGSSSGTADTFQGAIYGLS